MYESMTVCESVTECDCVRLCGCTCVRVYESEGVWVCTSVSV